MKKVVLFAIFVGLLSSFSFSTPVSKQSLTISRIQIFGDTYQDGTNRNYLGINFTSGLNVYISSNDVSYQTYLTLALSAKSKPFNVDVWYEAATPFSLGGTPYYQLNYLNLR